MRGMNKIRTFSLIAATLAIGAVIVGQSDLFAAQKKEMPAAVQTTQGVGRLIIVRAANLGPTIVGLKIDGKDVDKISYNRRYDAPIAAGAHVLTVYPVVSYEGARPVDARINVEPGKTYTFTAARKDIQVVLK
jgi:hypothetical protein